MNFTIFKKRAASIGMAALLLVGVVPFHAFATENAAQDSCKLQIQVEVQVDGAPQEAVPFTCILQTEDENSPMPESSTLTIQGEGEGKFGEIVYGQPGEYEYTVYQRNDEIDHYTYDDSSYTVKVTVEEDSNGQLTAAYVAYQHLGEKNDKGKVAGKADRIAFVNEYSLPEPVVSPEPSEEPVVSPAPSEAPVVPTEETTPSEEPAVSAEPSQEPTASPEPSEKPAESVKPSTSPTTSPKPSSTTTTTTSTTSTPKTGDDTNNLPWIVLLCAVVAGVIGCVGYLNLSRKRNR